MRTSIGLIMLLLLLAGLSGCTYLVAPLAMPQAWIDAPLDGTVLPLAPYDLVAHASDPGGIAAIEFNVNGSVIGNVAGSGPIFTAHQSWTPAEPGRYIIQARGSNASGTWSDYAEVTVIVQGEAPNTAEPNLRNTPEPLLPIPTPGPPSSPTPTLTPTPSQPTFVLIQNANCRRGPGQVYEVLTSLLQGQEVPILARSEDGTWWLVRIPTGEQCWISGVTGTASGDPNAVPVATGAPGCYVLDQSQNQVCTIPCPKKNPKPADLCTP